MTQPAIVPFADAEELCHAAAREFVRAARSAIRLRGQFTAALSGGSTPRRLFQLLAAEPYRSKVDWSRVHLFWGDERCVPPDHADANYRTVHEALLTRAPIPAANVHRLEAERPDREAVARDYQATIARVCGVPADGPPASLDLVLLGMGPDGHTASLFPGNPALAERTRWVTPVANAPKPPPDRITLTAPLLNAARATLFLITGADKADPLFEVLDGEPNIARFPSQLALATEGALSFFVDRAAAARLPKEQLSPNRILLAPSILAADFARLGEQVQAAEAAGADRIHVDVMDGHFVPNISFGALVVRALRPITDLPLECHLMIADPDKYLDDFAAAGADTILVHVENNANLHRTVHHIKHLGLKCGVVLNPATSIVTLAEMLPDVDLVLAMTVNPGFGGQSFIPASIGKVKRIRQMITATRPEVELEVDGGIDVHSAPGVVEAGARVLVAGSAVFGHKGGIAAGMEALRTAVGV